MPSSAAPPVVDAEVPTWKSPNELIHERINFEDTIWGFGLAGGAYYKTPLRITYVKPGSRAQMAHIYPGDVVVRINGIESSTLTLEEAHQIILESGIHLKINVTSPEDLEDNYYCYIDPLEAAKIEELQAKQIKHKAIPQFPKVLGKCSHWSLQWPWKSKRKIIYKESNCYLVPSKFEEKHKDTRKPEVKQDDMVVLDSIHSKKGKKNAARKNESKDSVIEQTQSADKNENEVATEQISPIDKNNEIDTMEQNGPVDIKIEDADLESNTSVDKIHEDVTADVNSSIDTDNKDVLEQNTSVDKAEGHISAQQISSADKTEGDIATDQESSVAKTDADVVAEHNSSEENIIENSAQEDSTSVNDNIVDDSAEQNSAADNIDEQNSVEAIDSTEKTKTDGDNMKLENSDIPGLTESDKLNHNSR